MEAQSVAVHTNRNAIISLIASTLTVVAFCLGVVPVPLTGFVCFPVSAVLGMAALAIGLISLHQIHSSGENGRIPALIGAWIGGLATTVAFCALVSGILLLPEIANFIRQVSK